MNLIDLIDLIDLINVYLPIPQTTIIITVFSA